MATFTNIQKSFQPSAEIDFLFSDSTDFLFSDDTDYVFVEYQDVTPWYGATKNISTWSTTNKS